MIKTIPVVFALAFALALSAPTVARAEEPETSPPSWDRSQEMLEEGAKRVIGALELLLQAIPQYEMPEVLPNGDIIIRRKHPEDEEPAPAPDQDKT
jgi:hypothetical protein